VSRIGPPPARWDLVGCVFMLFAAALAVAILVTCEGCGGSAHVRTARTGEYYDEGSGESAQTLDIAVHNLAPGSAYLGLILDDEGADWCVRQPLREPVCGRTEWSE
jgi:hypothetical protein